VHCKTSKFEIIIARIWRVKDNIIYLKRKNGRSGARETDRRKGLRKFLQQKCSKWNSESAGKKYARTSRVRRETSVRKTLYFITWITRLLTSRSRLNVTSFYVLCKIVQMSLQESDGVLKGLPFVLFPIVLRDYLGGVLQPTEKVYLIC